MFPPTFPLKQPRVFGMTPGGFASVSREEQKLLVQELIQFWAQLSSPVNRAHEAQTAQVVIGTLEEASAAIEEIETSLDDAKA